MHKGLESAHSVRYNHSRNEAFTTGLRPWQTSFPVALPAVRGPFAYGDVAMCVPIMELDTEWQLRKAKSFFPDATQRS